MLETLDLLIGFVVVMLVVSMAVTLVTQMISEALNLRGQALRSGIAELLLIIDRKRMTSIAEKIADHILRDPLISRGPRFDVFTGGLRKGGFESPKADGLAQVIQREELTRLLLVFADKDNCQQTPRVEGMTQDELDEMRVAFAGCLAENDVADPNDLLKRIRAKSLELERDSAQLSNSDRANKAILAVVETNDFVAKINGWFDQTIDRVGDQFAMKTRTVTAAAALGVAVFLQLDALALVNRLSTDEATRGALVELAIRSKDDLKPPAGEPTGANAAPATSETKVSTPSKPDAAAGAAAPAPAPASGVVLPPSRAGIGAGAGAANPAPTTPPSPPAPTAKPLTAAAVAAPAPAQTPKPDAGKDKKDEVDPVLDAAREELWNKDIISVARTPDAWWTRWTKATKDGQPPVSLWGVLLSALLLSLGAPFWYEALKNLLKMRSVLAGKDDVEREKRQTENPPPPKPAAAAPPPATEPQAAPSRTRPHAVRSAGKPGKANARK